MIRDKVFHKTITLSKKHIKALTDLAMFLINLTQNRFSPLRFRIRVNGELQCCSLGWASEMIENGSLAGSHIVCEFNADIQRHQFSWDKFCYKNFGMTYRSDLGQYLFSSEWSGGKGHFDQKSNTTLYDYDKPDKTPVGAGRRILYVLEHGLPSNWKNQLEGTATLSYRVGE